LILRIVVWNWLLYVFTFHLTYHWYIQIMIFDFGLVYGV
jgi:hypothetical protein